MAQRRSSASSGRPNLGEPYQIYTEVVNAGKNLQGSKRKVKWLFGFTESDSEYEVVLVHSVVSGKKTIFEDGKEIITSANILASDFSHGWNSEICHRLFRIEANIGLTSEHTYTFSIDGVKFVDMPRKPLTGSKTAPKAQPFSDGATRRVSGTATERPPAAGQAPRGNFQSPFSNNTSGGGAADPFASGGDTFDPFGDDEGGFKPNKSASSGSKPKVTTTNANQKSTAATSLFASFDDDTATSDSNSFDPFSSGGNNTSQSGFGGSDPFHATSAAPAKKTEAPKRSPATATAAPARKASVEPDLFGNFDEAAAAAPARSEDPFAASTSGAAPKPTRRSSAQEIQMDFAGLSFEAQPAPKPVVSAPAPTPAPATEDVIVPEPDSKPKDPWDATKNLVNLDLTGKNAKPQPRPSVTSGPTLDNLLGAQPQRRASTNTAVPIDPFAMPSGPPPTTYYGGGMPSNAPPAPVYGRGLAGGPQPVPPQPFQPMGGGMGGMGGGIGGTMGGGMGGPMSGRMNARGSIGGPSQFPYQNPNQSQQQKNTSSLDSLAWK